MSSQPEVVLEADASPIVRIIANNLKLALHEERIVRLMRSMRGSFALASTKDPQAVTITITSDNIHLSTGVSPRTKVVVRIDFDKMADPRHKPKIEGMFRHPYFTYQIGKLLSVPLPDWNDSAKRFWAAANGLPDMPAGLKVTCSDEDRSLNLGEGDDSEIVADAHRLAELFVGNSILANEVQRQRIRVKLSMRHLAGLSNAGIKLLLGESHG